MSKSPSIHVSAFTVDDTGMLHIYGISTYGNFTLLPVKQLQPDHAPTYTYRELVNAVCKQFGQPTPESFEKPAPVVS